MIIVTGSVRARPEALEEVLRLSLEHVQRSRQEPGCLLHSVHQDVEDPNRVVFVEHWADRAALEAHFRVAASRTFVMAAGALATDPPTLRDLRGLADQHLTSFGDQCSGVAQSSRSASLSTTWRIMRTTYASAIAAPRSLPDSKVAINDIAPTVRYSRLSR